MKETTYIKFKENKSPSNSSKFNIVIKKIAYKVFRAILGTTNPDFDKLSDDVEFWKIEYETDDDGEGTMREIGFNINGKAIVAMPLGDNYGMWVDSHFTLELFNKFNPTTISGEEFNSDWDEFEKRFNLNK